MANINKKEINFKSLYDSVDKNSTKFKCTSCFSKIKNLYNQRRFSNSSSGCESLDYMFCEDIYGYNHESYNCDRKALLFVKKYGASYISEIYRYIEQSKILEKYDNQTIDVLVLGCGFDPWLYAINEYIKRHSLNININYTGYDNSNNWNIVRPQYDNVIHKNIDLTTEQYMNFMDYDFVIIDKMFSSIRRMNNQEQKKQFLQNINIAIGAVLNGGYGGCGCHGGYLGKEKHPVIIFREQLFSFDIKEFDDSIKENFNEDLNIRQFVFQGKNRFSKNQYILDYKKNSIEIENKNLIYDFNCNSVSMGKIFFNSCYIEYYTDKFEEENIIEDTQTELNQQKYFVYSGKEIINFYDSNLPIGKKLKYAINIMNQLEKEIKNYRIKIANEMKKRNIDQYNDDYVTISYVEEKIQQSIDGKKLKTDYPALYEKYSKYNNISANVRIYLKDRRK